MPSITALGVCSETPPTEHPCLPTEARFYGKLPVTVISFFARHFALPPIEKKRKTHDICSSYIMRLYEIVYKSAMSLSNGMPFDRPDKDIQKLYKGS